MGSGTGIKVDLSLIMRVVALICCSCALGLSLDGSGASGRSWATFNCFEYATGGYIIVLAFFIGWAIFKDQVDTLFAGCIVAFGFIYNLGAGAAMVSFYSDYRDVTMICVAGVLAMVAGIVMLVDALHSFGVF